MARACTNWIHAKVEIRSIRQANLLHGKMYHIANGGAQDAILGSSNFTISGLGLGGNGHDNIELNLVVDSNRDHKLLAWFDALWNNRDLVEDVREQVLEYLAQLYHDEHAGLCLL